MEILLKMIEIYHVVRHIYLWCEYFKSCISYIHCDANDKNTPMSDIYHIFLGEYSAIWYFRIFDGSDLCGRLLLWCETTSNPRLPNALRELLTLTESFKRSIPKWGLRIVSGLVFQTTPDTGFLQQSYYRKSLGAFFASYLCFI